MERHPNYVLSSGPARRTTKWGAGWALRQSLVDLASVCELLAGELPRPRIPSRQAAARGVKRAV